MHAWLPRPNPISNFPIYSSPFRSSPTLPFSFSAPPLSSFSLSPPFLFLYNHNQPPPYNMYVSPSLAAQQQLENEGERESLASVVANADVMAPSKLRVTVVGSGNWGSVAAKLIASNALKLPSFHDEVRMWVFEETLPTGEKLSAVINQANENVKYLPGIKLGKNVVADPDIEHAVRDANMLVFVTPHQFVEGICKRLIGNISKDAEAISLIKGMEVKMEGPCMISTLISQQLQINCCVLMGANIANGIAVEKFSEATVGYRGNKEIPERWVQLFNHPYFMVSAVQDVEGVELCGTLKNVVAIAAGFVDGLEMGNNTKAAIMRIGLREMKAFSKRLFPSVKDSTFFESCGVAYLITTCLGGRNRKCAEAFARNGGKRSFEELEAEMLQGQKLQMNTDGVSTAKEVYEVLRHRRWLELFPLFTTVHEICSGRHPPSAIVEYSEHTPKLSLLDGSARLLMNA